MQVSQRVGGTGRKALSSALIRPTSTRFSCGRSSTQAVPPEGASRFSLRSWSSQIGQQLRRPGRELIVQQKLAAMSGMEGEVVGGAPAMDGEAPESTDFANYFCTYGFIYHQKDMLEDHKRTGAYYHAVMNNRKQFEGKVVLDVGTGSGILAIFAAKAGAKKVYAVEATDMAKLARRVVESNGLSDVITVIQGMVESVSLPEKVDIIISEWMGYFLLRESMLDSVLLARDRFLKPGGAMYPSHARMYFAPIRTNSTAQRMDEYENNKEGWEYFNSDMKSYYGVDLGCLTGDFHNEQKDYYLNSTAWQDVHPAQLLGQPMCFKSYDLGKVTIEEVQQSIKATCTLPIQEPAAVQGLCSWFDVQFAGSPENPADETVLLTTAPDATGATHWGQQTFFLSPPIEAGGGDALRIVMEINRKKENHRLMRVELKYKLQGNSPAANSAEEISRHFHIE